jgi:hypothetical protein
LVYEELLLAQPLRLANTRAEIEKKTASSTDEYGGDGIAWAAGSTLILFVSTFKSEDAALVFITTLCTFLLRPSTMSHCGARQLYQRLRLDRRLQEGAYV